MWITTRISEMRRGEKQMAEPVCGGTPTLYEHGNAHLVRVTHSLLKPERETRARDQHSTETDVEAKTWSLPNLGSQATPSIF